MGIFDKLKKKNQKNQPVTDSMYLYSEKELNEYEAYIEKSLGHYDNVFHEIVSPDIHLDVIIVPPTEANSFYKLVTMGMGAYTMNVPQELKEYELEHAELIMYLPADWNIGSDNEKDYWPIRYLKVLARLPLQLDTWLGFGHTVQGNADMAPFAENTKLSSIMLLTALNLEGEIMELRLSSGKKLNFYQLFPIYKEELEYKQQTSAEKLLALFDGEDFSPVLNINRKNYCK